MTVQELIAKLQMRPQNMTVLVPTGDDQLKELISDEMGVKAVKLTGQETSEKCMILVIGS